MPQLIVAVWQPASFSGLVLAGVDTGSQEPTLCWKFPTFGHMCFHPALPGTQTAWSAVSPLTLQGLLPALSGSAGALSCSPGADVQLAG